MSIFDAFKLNRQPDGDDEERAGGQPRRLMRCLTVGCDRPALDADAFCAVCAGRRLAFMVFGEHDLEDWPTRAVQEPLTHPTMPALPAYPPSYPPLPNLNAAGDPALVEPQQPMQPQQRLCRWCAYAEGEQTREPVMQRWIAADPLATTQPCRIHQRIERLWQVNRS